MSAVARNATVFASMYMLYGLANPFMPLWLKAKGLPPDKIALILAGPLFAKIILGPLIARSANAGSRFKYTALFLMFLSSALYAALNGFSQALITGVTFCLATFLSSLVAPILDGFITSQPAEVSGRYAFVRSFGSAAYIVSSVCGGAAAGMFGTLNIAWIAAILTAISGCVMALLMAKPAAASPNEVAEIRSAPVSDLLRNGRFLGLIASVSLIQLASGYYGLAPVIWSKSGFSPQWIGILWGVAVVSEVVYFQFADRLSGLIAPGRVLIIGACAAICRDVLLGLKLPIPLVALVQILQVAAYSAPYLASIQLVSRLVPPEYAATAQTIRWAFTAGVAPALALLIGGTFVGRLQERGYWVMIPFGLIALISAVQLNGNLRADEISGEARVRSAATSRTPWFRRVH